MTSDIATAYAEACEEYNEVTAALNAAYGDLIRASRYVTRHAEYDAARRLVNDLRERRNEIGRAMEGYAAALAR